MNLQALLLVHLLCVEATYTERTSSPFSFQMAFGPDTEAANISGNKQAFTPQLTLNHGTYHSKAYLMDSVSLSLHGSDTTICHTSSVTKTETTSDQNSENNEYGDGNTIPFIFVFSNSTLSMSHISLDCGWRGTSVGRISSSRLTIDNCPIISNPESSPFVMDNGCDDIGSSIFFVDCSHKSIDKSSLLALVTLVQSHTTHSRHTDNSQEVSSTLVSCSGLSLCDAHLVSGSGPLVGFSSSTEQDTRLWTKLETVLMGSRLVNMTSGVLKGSGKGVLEGWNGCQKILDSCVTQSTNHLYGTACIDMNLGGSLLCSNTSFSHCHSSLEPSSTPPNFFLEHRTATDPLNFGVTDTEAITFRRCTFLSMTSSSTGAAINHNKSPSSFTMSECSFSNCTVNKMDDGGAIDVFQQSSAKSPVAISSSHFLNCTSGRGGAVDLFYVTTCTIADVVFRNNTAQKQGGGLSVNYPDTFSISNCVFEKCIAETNKSIMGGGLDLHHSLLNTIDSLLFRECRASKGNDLYSVGAGPISGFSPNVTNCDSTSNRPNAYYDGKTDDTMIPAVSDTSTSSLVEIESTPSTDQTSSTIQMKVSNIVDGKMLVLVDNTNNHEPPNDDSPPAIARLLTFDFSTSIESAAQTVSFGEWEELQYESKYCVIGSWIAKTSLSFSSSIGLTTPNPARIVEIVCSLGSGTDHYWLELKGRSLPKGTYTVKLVGVSDFSFSVEFDGTTGTKTLNMFSSRHSERLFGTGSKLSFSTTYEVESVTFESCPNPFFLDPPRLFFTTPVEQSRLISIGPVNFKDESTKDIILIPLPGSLDEGEYVIILLSSSSPTESVSLPVTLSASNSETVEFLVYSKNSNEIQLKYGEIYTVEELITGTTKCLFEKVFSIQVPAEPKRIEEGMVTLNKAKDEATLRLKGRELDDGSYKLKLDSVSQELTSEASLSEHGELLFKVSISLFPTSIMAFGETYTISSLKFGSEDVLVNSDVELAVPNPPIVKTAQVHPNSINTSMRLGLTGTSLKLDGFYTVTLSPLFSLDILFNSSETVSSAELLLGRTACLQHNTEYKIVSIARVEDDSNVILTEATVSFTTPKFPVPLVLHVNGKEGEDDGLCGESDDACATIDFTWSIVVALNAKSATLAIVNSSEQRQPIVVSSGMSILLNNGSNFEPTLTIPSSASMEDKAGIIVVSEATLSIIDVTVKIESTDPSFVFLSASESTIILKEGSFVGVLPPTLSSNSDHEDVCSWESGIIRLDNTNTTLSRMAFSSLSQGVIHMKNGSVNLEGVIFHSNSPNLVSFPSARRNIRCVDGSVTIGSLSGGDGSKDHPSAWISTTDCTVSGDDARPNSALFVPTLSSESKSTWMKKEKRFSVLIVGTTLIPCGLSLEVFEMKKDKSEGESERIELSFDTADSFNDTHITLSVALTSLSSLDDALEWRGRLVFGLNETTSEWFVVQKNSADRKAESPLEHMKWWLPLVIVLSCCALFAIFVVIVVVRRRQQQKALKQPNDPEEMPDEEKMEVQDNSLAQNGIQTSAGILKGKSLTPNFGENSNQSTKLNDIQGGSGSREQFVEVMDVGSGQTKEVVKMETLFERLHKNRNGIVGKRQRQIELARGLQKIGKTNGNAWILQKLTSHWILIGADGHFNLQLKEEETAATEHQFQSQTQTANSSVAEEGGSVDVNIENANGMDRAAKEVQEKEDQEGQRWQAPEQGEHESMPPSDLEKVTVFRLGLVLWEMETGQVPFRETDGVNAGRQLKAGVKPQMDLVENKEMEELILKCLELKATDRIGLDDLISSLSSIPDDPVPTQP
ncbi:hypothetical protein BLNAU_19595 [Blattamonas nauphoetae]|uniref:Protein kinase domain-containing protein n=1 Tax=Blattamonas nauphoetae TaxID=2049346 RepID=A0ABQ9X0Z6_9EUKA|nr:hypothetical protein BLNAU_19595 [Blattamonas nauphoetae]